MSAFSSEVSGGIPRLASFGQTLSTDETNELLSRPMRLLLDRLSEAGWAAAGLFIADCITCGHFHTLCDYGPDVQGLSAHDQYVIGQCLAFFKKRGDIDLGLDREDAATRKFWAAERACALTNECFRNWASGRFVFDPDVEHVLHVAQRKISDLLKDAPTLEDIRPRFGPGATTQVPKKNASPVVKLGMTPACSANLAFTFPDTLGEMVSEVSAADDWFERAMDDAQAVNDDNLYEVLESERTRFQQRAARGEASLTTLPVEHSKLAFVPKNAKTDRAICTEPMLNGMYQLGFGELIAKALRRVGIDIRDQGPNQRAAMYGSISNASATVDLSSASDTVSLLLCDHLLPEGWSEWIWKLRSATCEYKGEDFVLQKVSSMGNGFTFPLETLIFWALAQGCVEKAVGRSRIRTLVYGDDIVIDKRAVPLLFKVFSSLGFQVNPGKSFWEGEFRESCGKDYVYGTNVRPVYVSDCLDCAALFTLHNYFVERGDCEVAAFFEASIESSVRRYGPRGYGDGHLHVDSWPAKAHTKHGMGGVTFETYTTKPKQLRGDIVKRFCTLKEVFPMVWDAGRGEYVRSKTKSTVVEYHRRAALRVMRLATYTQYLREKRPVWLTESDRIRCELETSHRFTNRREPPLRDRRMPDPDASPGRDTDFLVVPNSDIYHLTKVYIFETPAV